MRLTTPAATSVKSNPTGSGSRKVYAMFTSGFLYASLNAAICLSRASISACGAPDAFAFCTTYAAYLSPKSGASL